MRGVEEGRKSGRRRDGRRLPCACVAALLGAALVLEGGCASGPCVRTSPEAAAWNPGTVMMLPAVVADGAVSTARGLPPEVAPYSPEQAGEEVAKSLKDALTASSSAGIIRVSPETSGTLIAGGIETINRQYLSMPALDPDLAASLGRALGAEAILLTAVLRYGPEAEGDAQVMQQSAQTRVGASQLSINSTASRTVVYLNCAFRCRLVRCGDAAAIWDVSVSERQKRVAVLSVTQESVLEKAVSAAVAGFPYNRPATPRPASP